MQKNQTVTSVSESWDKIKCMCVWWGGGGGGGGGGVNKQKQASSTDLRTTCIIN